MHHSSFSSSLALHSTPLHSTWLHIEHTYIVLYYTHPTVYLSIWSKHLYKWYMLNSPCENFSITICCAWKTMWFRSSFFFSFSLRFQAVFLFPFYLFHSVDSIFTPVQWCIEIHKRTCMCVCVCVRVRWFLRFCTAHRWIAISPN